MDFYDLVKDNWQNDEKIASSELNLHISNYNRMDELLPHDPRFYVLLNLHTMEYDFLGSAQEALTGYSNDEVAKRGLKFLMEQMHPDDAPYIARDAYQRFSEMALQEPVSQRKNLLLHENYRFRHKDGEWLHLIEHVWIVKLDDDGNPHMTLSHVYQLPSINPFRGNILIKKLQADNTYKTLYSQTYPRSEEAINVSPREVEIVQLIARGLKGKEIADRLHISYETVRTHRKNILSKLELKTSGELTAFAISNGLI